MKSKMPKESNFPESKHTSKDILNKNPYWIRLLRGSSPSVSLKQIISHKKGHYGWKNLNQVSNEGSNPGRLKRTKVLNIKRMQKAWE